MVASQIGPAVLGHWGPLYDSFLAVVFRVAGPDPVAAKIAQILVSVGTVALIYGLARSTGGVRAARIAAAMASLYPSYIAYTHYLFSETVFLALLTGAVYALHKRPDRPTRAQLVAAGILFGLTALTRSVALYFLPLWVAWCAIRRRPDEARDGAIVLGIALLVILPWTVRNAFQYKSFLLIDGTIGETAYHAFSNVPFNRDIGFNREWSGVPRDRPKCNLAPLADLEWIPHPPGLAKFFPRDRNKWVDRTEAGFGRRLILARAQALTDLPARQRCELGRAWEYAREHPGTIVSHVFYRFYAFWGPNSFWPRAIYWRVYPDGPLAFESFRVATVVVFVSYLLVMLPAILALGRSGAPRIVEWTLLFAGYYSGIHMLAVAYSRYRLPLMPLAMVLASLWLARPGLPEGRRRTVLIGLTLVGFLVLCFYYAGTRLWLIWP